MLRSILLVIGGGALALALLAALGHAPLPFVLWMTIVGVALVGGILFERGRYKPATPGRPGSGWIATGERFIDPQTGEPVTVYYQPSTGERRYVGQ
jgi:hypothetical protein